MTAPNGLTAATDTWIGQPLNPLAADNTEAATEPTVHIVELPASLPLLNSNDRLHYMAKARQTTTIRQAAAWCARIAKVPPLGQATITVVVHPHNKRRLDPQNWAPTAKAAIDGIVDAGVLYDDDSTRLLAVTYVLGETRVLRQVALHITEIAGAA
jgi:hypothetical protein